MYLYTVNFGNYDQIPPNHYYSKKLNIYVFIINRLLKERDGSI